MSADINVNIICRSQSKNVVTLYCRHWGEYGRFEEALSCLFAGRAVPLSDHGFLVELALRNSGQRHRTASAVRSGSRVGIVAKGSTGSGTWVARRVALCPLRRLLGAAGLNSNGPRRLRRSRR